MALSTVDSKIQKAITDINTGSEHTLAMCGYLQAMRGRENTYLSKAQGIVKAPILIHFIEEREVTLKNGNRVRTIDFYLMNDIDKNTNPEFVRNVHDALDEIIHKFFQNLQTDGLRPAYVGQKERLIEQVAALYDAGIMFQLTIELDARC